tara:strand:+ start:11854 stop:12816 length:963 start_codon:yes stop_codon:yes gene_type:complete
MSLKRFSKYTTYVPGEKLIVRLDPSTFAISDCERELELGNLMGWVENVSSHKMEYGSAIHNAAAEFVSTKCTVMQAVQVAMEYFRDCGCDPGKDWRNAGHLLMTTNGYLTKYINDPFQPATLELTDDEGKKFKHIAVELPFEIPFRSYPHVDIILCGVIDSYGTMDGVKCFKDIKSTASWDIPKFFEKYRTSIQLMIYAWAMRHLGWVDYYPPALIDGIFLRDNVNKTAKFERSGFIDFEDSQVDDTMDWVRDRCDRIATLLEEDAPFLKNPTRCEKLFGKCKFMNICWEHNETLRDVHMRRLKQVIYDPKTFGTPNNQK